MKLKLMFTQKVEVPRYIECMGTIRNGRLVGIESSEGNRPGALLRQIRRDANCPLNEGTAALRGKEQVECESFVIYSQFEYLGCGNNLNYISNGKRIK